MAGFSSEIAYRNSVIRTLKTIEDAFEEIDPDLVECSVSQGALTLLFADGSKLIVSSQPSVRQLWLAVASQGIAYHMNWDDGTGKWMDDKGKGVELFTVLKQIVWEQARVALDWV